MDWMYKGGYTRLIYKVVLWTECTRLRVDFLHVDFNVYLPHAGHQGFI